MRTNVEEIFDAHVGKFEGLSKSLPNASKGYEFETVTHCAREFERAIYRAC